MNTITSTSSATPGSTRSCMISPLRVRESVAAQGNMADACHRKISALNPPKQGTGRSAYARCSPTCEESRWFMPLSRSLKAGTAAADFFSAQKTRKALSWIMAAVKTKPYAAMEMKTQSFSPLPVIRLGGISKYRTMRARHSGHWKIAVCGAARALSVWSIWSAWLTAQ